MATFKVSAIDEKWIECKGDDSLTDVEELITEIIHLLGAYGKVKIRVGDMPTLSPRIITVTSVKYGVSCGEAQTDNNGGRNLSECISEGINVLVNPGQEPATVIHYRPKQWPYVKGCCRVRYKNGKEEVVFVNSLIPVITNTTTEDS